MVKMTSGNETAWSESTPFLAPTYSPECAFGAYYVASEFLAPLVLHKNFESAKEINDAMAVIKGNPFAHAAIEIAWWTLQSKLTKTPLHTLLGGSDEEVAVGADFGRQPSIDILLNRIDDAIQSGFQRIKLKAMPGWDLDMLRAVRSTFPKFTFHIDCNSGYTLNDLPLFKEIDKLGLAMIEQPLFHADIIDHAKLQKALDTPICLDESISSPYMAEKAIELDACRIINIKPGRCGGLYNSMKINELAQSAGIGCWIGGMMESDVGKAICTEAAGIANMVYPHDITPSTINYPGIITESVIEETPQRTIQCIDRIGTPIKPDLEKLKAKTLDTFVLEAE
jgi:O-succinylbenzoate synthase